jgi:hypothetical protein
MMRAKVTVQSVKKTQYGEELHMTPVASKSFGPNGESEDNTYARYTPSGDITLTVTNPDLAGKFTPGQALYVDFTPAEG